MSTMEPLVLEMLPYLRALAREIWKAEHGESTEYPPEELLDAAAELVAWFGSKKAQLQGPDLEALRALESFEVKA